jgi:hypothetical protein
MHVDKYEVSRKFQFYRSSNSNSCLYIFFICDVFNDSVSILDYVTLNYKMIDEKLLGNDSEGGDRDPV